MRTFQLQEYKETWEKKQSLRLVYEDQFRRIIEKCRQGKTLEIGGGVGNFKSFRSDVVSSDIQHASWLDVVCDAQRLPFANESFANIILFDVYHHIEFPLCFLKEASRVLAPQGRLIMVEPAITPVSWVAYNFLHYEPVDMQADPMVLGEPTPGRDPYEGNQAIATLLFGPYRQKFETLCPELRVSSVDLFSFFAYPLSGGFQNWSAIPDWLIPSALKAEKLLEPLLKRFCAFRLLGVIERE